MTAIWVVNFFYMGIKCSMYTALKEPYEEGSAKEVPAAGVIRRIRALSGFIGFKGRGGGLISQL